MILNHTADIYGKFLDYTSEGEEFYNYIAGDSLQCNIQPMNLSKIEYDLYGISDKVSGIRKMFYTENALELGDRVLFMSKFYEVKNINPWSAFFDHFEALLVPVQGAG